MKIEIEVDGRKCKAETDYGKSSGFYDKAAFEKLCAEVRAIAYHLIDAKYGKWKGAE